KKRRRCLQPSNTNTSCDEHAAMESDVSNWENTSLPRCDVGIQCPGIVDHSYSSNKNKSMIDSATQTDPAASVSAHDFNDKDYKCYTGLGLKSFWQLVYVLIALHSQLKLMNLAVHEQVVLVLTSLCLGLMFKDLGKRFGISRSTAFEIFTFWRPILAKCMREKVIAWLPRDTLSRMRAQIFMRQYLKVTCIIDCTEIFVQKPMNLMKLSQTYSNYKHHNTYKVLYCIAPNGYVMFDEIVSICGISIDEHLWDTDENVQCVGGD
ncbi:uncharacterized protein LOC126397490, partial [Scomber scombrus]